MKNFRNAQKKLIKASLGTPERSLDVTPTNLSLIKLPMLGESTVQAKLPIPVNMAKQLASIFLGVILAYSTIIGSMMIANLNESKTTSVPATKMVSGMPTYRFNLLTNITVFPSDKIFNITLYHIKSLTSNSFR